MAVKKEPAASGAPGTQLDREARPEPAPQDADRAQPEQPAAVQAEDGDSAEGRDDQLTEEAQTDAGAGDDSGPEDDESDEEPAAGGGELKGAPIWLAGLT